MPKMEIVVQAAGWRRRLPDLARFARDKAAAAHAAAVAEGTPGLCGTIVLAFADDAAIWPLNARFRGQDKATNVLSFPAATGSGGDIMLALETVAREAETQGKTFADHTAHLIVHGILHLMGYDHLTARQARPMELLERAILARFGIADPYDRTRGSRPQP